MNNQEGWMMIVFIWACLIMEFGSKGSGFGIATGLTIIMICKSISDYTEKKKEKNAHDKK